MLKYYKHKLSNSSKVFKFLEKWFPKREIIIKRNGNFKVLNLPSWAQLLSIIALLLAVFWVSSLTYMYFNIEDIMQKKEQEITKIKNMYSKVASEITLYTKNIQEINERLKTSFDDSMEKLLEKGELTIEEKNKIEKNRIFLSAELEYLNNKFERIAGTDDTLSIIKDTDYYNLKELELERDIAWQEREKLRKRNEELEVSIKNMEDAQANLLEKIELVAEENIDDIEKTVNKISNMLSKIGLGRSSDGLIRKFDREENMPSGGPFIPLEEKEILNENLNENFMQINSKVDKWFKLKQIQTMLPLGNPLKSVRITSGYGRRSDPFTGAPSMHRGIDFRGDIGTPLYAVADGKVIWAGPRGDYGKAVQIDHGLGFSTLYAHLSDVEVKKGDIVTQKQLVGLGGNTGRSTGPHLHYEVRYNNRPFNPSSFLKAEEIAYEN
jgi:murein DD-endopeptidase MepM/ murein hydrolase activator NlpD